MAVQYRYSAKTGARNRMGVRRTLRLTLRLPSRSRRHASHSRKGLTSVLESKSGSDHRSNRVTTGRQPAGSRQSRDEPKRAQFARHTPRSTGTARIFGLDVREEASTIHARTGILPDRFGSRSRRGSDPAPTSRHERWPIRVPVSQERHYDFEPPVTSQRLYRRRCSATCRSSTPRSNLRVP